MEKTKVAVRYFSRSGNTKRLADVIAKATDSRNFYCRGEFAALHKGRPNQDDLDAAKKFALEIMERK